MTYMWRSRSAWDARASISDFSSFCTKIQIQIQSKGLRHVTIQSHYLHDVPLFKTSVQQWHVTEVIQRFGWSVAGLCTSSRNQWTQQTHNMIIKHCSVSLSDLHPHSRRFKTKGKSAGIYRFVTTNEKPRAPKKMSVIGCGVWQDHQARWSSVVPQFSRTRMQKLPIILKT